MSSYRLSLARYAASPFVAWSISRAIAILVVHYPNQRSVFYILWGGLSSVESPLGLASLVVDKRFEVIQEIWRRGSIVLLIEQNVRQAPKMATGALVLENGAVVMQGKGSDLLPREELRIGCLGLKKAMLCYTGGDFARRAGDP